MKTQNPKDLLRLRQIILTDNMNLPSSAVEILKSDSKAYFRNHFKLDENSYKMELNVTDDGTYHMLVTFSAKEMYDIKVIQ